MSEACPHGRDRTITGCLLCDDTRNAEIDRLRADLAALRAWLDANTTYYDASYAAALAQFGKRIWLHATDDTSSYPFSAVVDVARAKGAP